MAQLARLFAIDVVNNTLRLSFSSLPSILLILIGLHLGLTRCLRVTMYDGENMVNFQIGYTTPHTGTQNHRNSDINRSTVIMDSAKLSTCTKLSPPPKQKDSFVQSCRYTPHLYKTDELFVIYMCVYNCAWVCIFCFGLLCD